MNLLCRVEESKAKLETFPSTRYGTVGAKVTTMTADAVMLGAKAQSDKGGSGKPQITGGAVFPASLTLAQNTIDVGGKSSRFKPGMDVASESKTSKHRMIEYFRSSVQSCAKENSMYR